MKIQTVKGFVDYLGEQAEKRAVIKEIVRQTFERYGFQPAETPIIEYEEFVKGENPYDEAVSDIYTLKDKGKRKLALRYELTFPLKRISKNKKLPYKRYQIGEVFRDEPITGNRTRQFTSCDIDILGSIIKDDAEILSIINNLLKTLKIDATIYVNNRKLLNEILEKENIDKKNTEEIIREIDKLGKLPEKEVEKNLKRFGAENILQIFKQPDKFFEKYKSYKEILDLKKYCNNYGFKFNFAPNLARGLSYYTGTIFEIKTKKIKETLFGGGSYTFGNIKGVGFGVSLERLELVTNLFLGLEKFLVISLNEDKKAVQIAQKLRNQGKNVTIFYGKPSKALEYANTYGMKKVIFVGKKEVKKKQIILKDMKTGKQKVIKIQRKILLK